MSKILRSSLLQAIKDLPPNLLPMPSSTFYSSHILPSRPAHLSSTSSTPIDIKHSKYKSLSHFLKSCAQEGLIKTKDQKGEVVITQVFSEHVDVKGHVVYKTLGMVEKKEEERAKKRDREEEKKRVGEVIVIELWKGIGNSHLQTFFKDVRKECVSSLHQCDSQLMALTIYSPSQLYTSTDLRAMITAYTTSHSLPNPTNQALIRLDPLLNALLLSSKENIDDLKREEILVRLCGKMQSWYRVESGDKNVTK